jgi:hypothetical protein
MGRHVSIGPGSLARTTRDDRLLVVSEHTKNDAVD